MTDSAGVAGGAATGVLTTPATPPAPSGDKPWYGETVAPIVQAKGWKTPDDAIQSYAALEKLMGADKAGRGVIWPKGDDDTEGWNTVYSKLGRPEKPDGYKLPDALVADPVAGKFRETAHQLGLGAGQFEKVVGWYQGEMEAAEKAVVDAQAAADKEALEKLRGEWGSGYDQNVELARRAGRTFGVDAETFSKIEQATGSAGLLKLFTSIGKALGEDKMPDGTQGAGGFALTPADARAKIAALQQDKAFVQKYIAGDTEARATMERLHKALG